MGREGLVSWFAEKGRVWNGKMPSWAEMKGVDPVEEEEEEEEREKEEQKEKFEEVSSSSA